MGEILGVGLSHFPPFAYPPAPPLLKQTINSPRVPEGLKDPRSWPAPMQTEWGDDEGASFAVKHWEKFAAGVCKVRAAVDEFRPDVVVIFGDDQYENFREEFIPPFCVYIVDEMHCHPYAAPRRNGLERNRWNEPEDMALVIHGHTDAARYLARRLPEGGFDIPYAYKLNYDFGLGHAFVNTIQYLDYDRTGWNYPIVPFHVNAYGSSVVRNQGYTAHLFSEDVKEPDPPAPAPRRCFELGQQIARVMKESPWRTVLVGSSSWSHGFLTEKNGWLYPDVDADRRRYDDLAEGRYEAFRDMTLVDVEDAGQNELLNWIPLVGAMHELGQLPSYCEFNESYIFNSCKVSAVFPPS
jgi:hypothetical protein